MWKCINGTAPGYLSELCIPVASASGGQHPWSASTGLLHVPRARTTLGPFGRRSFAVAEPSLWKSPCCTTETRDDSAHFQETIEGLSVPGQMSGEQKEHSPLPGAVVAFFVILEPGIKLQTYLLTYPIAPEGHNCHRMYVRAVL